MLKISSKASVILSMVVAAVLFAVLIAATVLLPFCCDSFFKIFGVVNYGNTYDKTVILCVAYAALAVSMLADVLLFILLVKVNAQQVFTSEAVALIRGVSWCCMLLAVIFVPLWFYFRIALPASVAAVFLGLCLRVVKNVIETACEIKSENDLTV